MADEIKLRVTGLAKTEVQKVVEETLGEEVPVRLDSRMPAQDPGVFYDVIDLMRNSAEVVEATIAAGAISKALYGKVKKALEARGATDVDWRNSEGYL